MTTSKKEWLEKNRQLEERFIVAETLTKQLDEQLNKHIKKESKKGIDLTKELHALESQKEKWKDHRFEIVVVGEFSTGKSTFINALLQQEVLPSKVTPTTATINFIRHSDDNEGREVAVVNYNDQRKEEVSFDALDEYVTEMSQNISVATEVHHVDLFIDSPYLKDGVVIVDTPGLQALHEEHEKITKQQIKESQASIFLSNMEQLGKQTEFELLSEVKDSIDRIFFIGNRLDGVPEDEVEQVIESFEKHLRENPYCPIESQHARLYPVSALQALKARDASVITKHWNDYTPEQLLEESRFEAFEERLESYLFGGEQAADALASPRQALMNHYETLTKKLTEFEQLMNEETDIEELEGEQKRLDESIELRKLQLNQQTRELESLFDDVIYQNGQRFDTQYKRLEEEIKQTVNDAPTKTDLYEELELEWAGYYKEYERLVDHGIQTLVSDLNETFREKVEAFEAFEVEEDEMNVEVERSTFERTSSDSSFSTESIQAELAAEFEEQLNELSDGEKKLQAYKALEREVRRKERMIEREERMSREDVRFYEQLVNSTPQMKKEERVVGKRFIFFDKKEMVDVSNDEYEERLKELEKLRHEKNKEAKMRHVELDELEEKAQSEQEDLTVTSMDELREQRRMIRQQQNERFRERLSVEQRKQERELKKERRRVLRQLEREMSDHQRAYRERLRSLDALQLAKQRIAQDLEAADAQLQEDQRQLDEKIQLLSQSKETQEQLQQLIEKAKEQMKQERIELI